MQATSRFHGSRRLAPVLAACALAAPAATAATAHAAPLRDSGPALRAALVPAPVPGPARGKGLVRPQPPTPARAVVPTSGGGDAVDWGAAGLLGAGTAAALALGLAGVRGGARASRHPAG